MSAIQVPLSAADRERIEQMVAQFRNQIENLYNIGYLQGQIDQANETREQLEGA